MNDSADDALLRWCDRLGIGGAYHDIWGKRHEVTDHGRRALLGELGVPQADAASLRAAQAQDWLRALPPLVAVDAGAPGFELVLRLPDSSSQLRWSVHEEGGDVHHGTADAHRLPETARATVDGRTIRVLRLRIEQPLPPGYHRLAVEGVGETLLVSAPPHCWRPPALGEAGRTWGPAVQLYALRSERNWGIGDFTDLACLAQAFGERGAGIVGVNPLHALFPHNPAHVSPYSPSSRSQLNVLYIDVEAIDDFHEHEAAQRHVRSAAFQERLGRLRAAEQVDHPGVAAAKFEVLRMLYTHFRERHLQPGSRRGRAFRAFQAERGPSLRLHATFEALQARFHARDASVWGWPVWPQGFRDPRSPDVLRFQQEQVDQVEYHEYLQWQADRQLAAVSHRCRDRGLAVGLYLDLAVSVDRAGSDLWGHQSLYAAGATVGAPPDELAPQGQNWGLPPLRPDALIEDRCRFFIDTLRGCMRHAGALRIDHVMGLMRLYWIPPDQPASEGAYVHYPLRELMAVVALESQRQRCMVIGEDLGTVADEMRAALARSEVLSYRVLYFERAEDGSFKPPQDYPRDALVTVSTHDLPTLAGWWRGHDIEVRRRIGLYPDDRALERDLAHRAQERLRLSMALQRAGLLPEDVSIDPSSSTPLTPQLVEAVHAYLADTPSRVMVMQLEDALGVLDQPNLPGTVDEHPNWRRKLPLSVDALTADENVRSLTDLLARLRPHAPLRAGAAPRAEAIIPRATYRLQFHQDFTFDQAIEVLPYLERLGVSHVYCSPLTRARAGSKHGYDVVAHDEINPELGGREGFDRFSAALRDHGLGLVLDIVPNHMGVLGPDNAWWADVLENGEASAYARYFDIDWRPADRDLYGKVLLPVLGAPFGQVLEDGQIQAVFDAGRGSFWLTYYEHRFPLDPRGCAPLLQRAALRLPGTPGLALDSLASAFGHLPARDASEPQARAERMRDKELLKDRLARLVRELPDVRNAVEAVLAETNTPDALEALHQEQAYRLAYWRVASDEINYRRFFDVNDLAALRMEEQAVFEATHGFVLELAAAGLVDGLRIDHPDGLHDPAQYFQRLQQGYARRAGRVLPERDEQGRPPRPLYVAIEKISAGHEELPEDWAVHGTTGYRFMNVVNGVLIDTAARARFDRLWRRSSDGVDDFEDAAYEGKKAIMRISLASELNVLTNELRRIAHSHRRTRDFTFNTLREALSEVAACMPVYRTYIVSEPSAQDRRFIEWAVGQARRRGAAVDRSVFDFVRQTLLAQAAEGADDALRDAVRRFAMRFQQFTAPVTAKGVEDTAFYRYSRLVSCNEVGGNPGAFGLSVRSFHAANADRAARWPHTMLATSTHDNKRSEDVRCRLDVLSEMPFAWRLWLRRFNAAPQLQRVRAAEADGAESIDPAPSPADEYLLLQTLLATLPAGGLTDATLPAYRERIEGYLLKAAREAKRRTSWMDPNAEYEEALEAFVDSLLQRVKPNPLLTDLQAQAEVLAAFGALNSLTLTLLKLTVPGVPDIYQGNELMDLSLVDPDNRRPVDYPRHASALGELEALAGRADWRGDLMRLAASPHDGRLKLWLSWRLLQLRRQHELLFRDGGYTPLQATGEREAHVLAFVREHRGVRVIVVCARLYARLLDMQMGPALGESVWRDTTVDLSPLVDEAVPLFNWLTGERLVVHGGRLRLAEVFATLPMAVLVGPGES